MPKEQKPQRDKFKQAALDLEADTDEKRWEERLRKVAKVAKDEPQGEPRKVVHKFKKAKERGES
jgi:hypothetical protein